MLSRDLEKAVDALKQMLYDGLLCPILTTDHDDRLLCVILKSGQNDRLLYAILKTGLDR